jgi:hypothetical protein
MMGMFVIMNSPVKGIHTRAYIRAAAPLRVYTIQEF